MCASAWRKAHTPSRQQLLVFSSDMCSSCVSSVQGWGISYAIASHGDRIHAIILSTISSLRFRECMSNDVPSARGLSFVSTFNRSHISHAPDHQADRVYAREVHKMMLPIFLSSRLPKMSRIQPMGQAEQSDAEVGV